MSEGGGCTRGAVLRGWWFFFQNATFWSVFLAITTVFYKTAVFLVILIYHIFWQKNRAVIILLVNTNVGKVFGKQ